MNPSAERITSVGGRLQSLTVKVGLVSVQVEFDGLHLGQVAVLRVLVRVTVGPGINQEPTS